MQNSVLNARSAHGLSLPAYVLETLSYAITLAYSWRNEFPFSTYGENFFLTLQNVVITLFIIHYAPLHSLTTAPRSTRQQLLAMAVSMAASTFALATAPRNVLAILQLSTLPLSLFSKLPQILQNYYAQSTGQLSAFAILSQIVGCATRLFTTATEVGDLVVSAGFILALLLNVVLGIQLWLYWGKDVGAKDRIPQKPVEGKLIEKGNKQEGKVEVVIPLQSPAPQQTIFSSQTGSYGRKWARKVD